MHQDENGRIVGNFPHIHFNHVSVALYCARESKGGLARPLDPHHRGVRLHQQVEVSLMAGEITTEFQSWDERADECLVLSVTMTFTFRMTGWSEANKYNVYSNLQAQK